MKATALIQTNCLRIIVDCGLWRAQCESRAFALRTENNHSATPSWIAHDV
jgi:hypothetical protein